MRRGCLDAVCKLHTCDQFWQLVVTLEPLPAFLRRLGELEDHGERGLVRQTSLRSDRAMAYPFHDRDILVTACGRICLHRKKINISTVLAGQRLGIKEVDDGIRLVSFTNYDLGYIDLEQKTLQPLDNPFGPRLSPMS